MIRSSTALLCAGIILTGLLAACDNGDNSDSSDDKNIYLPDPGDSAEGVHTYGYSRKIEEPRGEDVYEEACATCHDGGDYKAPHRSMLGLMS